ncbi:MAG: hypothetical protein HKN44_03145 [Ilumatobacter sp.]|nr:hypothetical protein [Ilumatobacter sp.]
MTTIDPTSDAVGHAGDRSDDVAAADSRAELLLAGIADWLTSTDHKRIGRLFLGGGFIGLLATAIVNIVLGIERGDIATVDGDAIAQLLDAQRVGLVFGTLLPLSLGLCIAVVPLQLGARSLAFPRLAATGFWMWVGGLVFSVIALVNDGGGLGGDADMVDLFIASHGLMAIGLTAAAGSIATSVLTTRAPGMTMRRVPFFSMSALITALGLLLVMPVLLGTLTYLFLDHRNARTGFGGNTGIYEWALWVFTQPTTFLFAIPAIGVLAEGAPLLFRLRTPARGVMFAGLGLIGVAAFTGVAQQSVHNLPWAGSDLYIGGGDDLRDKLADAVPWAMFNLLPLLGLVVVVLMSLFLAKPVKGARPNLSPAFAFGFLGAGMVLMGMLGTALFAIDDLALQGTVFEEGALIYVTYGAALGIMGGVAFWAPKLWGRTLPAGQLLPLAGLGLIATVLASLPSYVEGFDTSRDIYSIAVLAGHVLMALTALAFVALLATTLRNDDADHADDPYDAQTLEWTTPSPAPHGNFVDVPTVMSAEPLLDIKPTASTTTGSDA